MKLGMTCLLVIGAIAIVAAYPDGYTNKFDNIDVDMILQNDRLLKPYADCVLEKQRSRCPPPAVELKKVLSEALETECAKCSERQKEVVKKTIKFLIQNKPQIWKELKDKYDPQGKYTKKYEELAKKENVNV